MGTFPNNNSVPHILLFLRIGSVCTAIFLISLTACFSQKATRADADFESAITQNTKLAEDYFLLPSPDSKERDTLLKLFSAPLLSEELIYRKADLFENYSRSEMQKRRKVLLEELCKLPLKARKQRLSLWEEEKNRQLHNWAAIHAAYENSVEYQLQKRLSGKELNNAQIMRLTVKKLQAERQMLIEKNWQNYFRRLTTDRNSRACSDPAEKTSILNIQPEERLYLPYYIALYEFYSYLPDFVRMEMIIQLHSRQ